MSKISYDVIFITKPNINVEAANNNIIRNCVNNIKKRINCDYYIIKEISPNGLTHAHSIFRIDIEHCHNFEEILKTWNSNFYICKWSNNLKCEKSYFKYINKDFSDSHKFFTDWHTNTSYFEQWYDIRGCYYKTI